MDILMLYIMLFIYFATGFQCSGSNYSRNNFSRSHFSTLNNSHLFI